jgi:hypothetical protein
LETEQKEIQATGGGIPQQEAPQAPQSVGALLKAERERLGLSREQITEKTRMRAQVVEAIENEAWGALPPPVFVRGFLRTYAKVLGLNQETVMDRYAKCALPESSGHGQIPHLETTGNRRGTAWLVLLLLGVLVVVYGLWHLYPSSQMDQREFREAGKRDHAAAPAASQQAVASPPPVRPASEPVKQEAPSVRSASQEAPPTPRWGEGLARDQANEGDGWLSLTGIVKETTWLRIAIDGKEGKEYLLQRGARPQWRAREKFYILIGNAGGIDFDLNGKRVGELGKPGQVLRVTLPKDLRQEERAN